MANLTTRGALLCVALLTGCHSYAYYEPAIPPPPPTAPPPGAPWPSAVEDTAASTGTLAASTVASSSPPASSPPAASSIPSDQPPSSPSAGTEKKAPSTGGPLPPLPSQAPQYEPEAPAAPPAASEWVRPYAEGQWVYHSTYGWIWVPADAAATGIDGVPYTYLYTPRFGWTWYASPWGWGHYHYGPWVTHPVVRHHVWVAHPHIIVRLGRPRRVR